MDIFLLWWFAQANAISGVLQWGLIAATLAFCASMFLRFASEESPLTGDGEASIHRGAPKAAKWFAIALSVIASLYAVVPDRTGLAIIIGGKLSLDAIQSEEVSETAGKLYELVNRELDQRLEETEPEDSE